MLKCGSSVVWWIYLQLLNPLDETACFSLHAVPWLCPWIPPHLVSAQAILGFLSFIPSMALYLKGIVYFVIDCSCIFIHSNQLCLSRSLTRWQSNYWLENSPDISLFSTSLSPPMLHPFLPPLVFSWLKCGQRKTMCGSFAANMKLLTGKAALTSSQLRRYRPK